MSSTARKIEQLVEGLRSLGIPNDVNAHIAQIKETMDAVGFDVDGLDPSSPMHESSAAVILGSLPVSSAFNREMDDTASADDETRVEISSSPGGVYKSNGNHGKGVAPRASRNPVHRGSNDSNGSSRGAFVQSGKYDFQDDPFASTPSGGAERHRQSTQQHSDRSSPTNQRGSRSRASTNWRSTGSRSGGSPPESASKPKSSQTTYAEPEIDSKNAQAHFPPSACVFVANLLQTEDEQQLEYAVTKVFRQFGHVFVKIRRDSKNMPFAFCQFTTDEAAERAVCEGRGHIIHGRPCRTERARANCNYYVSRLYGKDLDLEEARKAMEPYGQLEKVWFPTESDMGVYPLAKGGVFVRFKFYENGREALTGLRDHELYRVIQFNKEHITPVRDSSLRDDYAARKYLSRYETDRRSIFVGNLPQHATEKQLQKLFGHFGAIQNLEFHQRRSNRADCELNVFAFIEYSEPTAVLRAVAAKNGFFVDGVYIKVVPKDSEHNRDGRVARRSIENERLVAAYGSPQTALLSENAVSPQYYGVPYGYIAAQPPTPMYSGGYGGYGPPQYAPAHVGYSPASYYSTGSPAYAPRSASLEPVGATNGSASYYQYHGYPYVGSEYYGQQAMSGYQPGPYSYANCSLASTQAHVSQENSAMARTPTPTPASQSEEAHAAEDIAKL
ncbi:MAG: hypothetical protein M1818_004858 [Claussenomyces sp. TS43310]|nr:MAG: hypothetical protein M1818_004858 [Claussenomyces sp. TS43310]